MGAHILVANISGISFNDYVRQNIFDPLGMETLQQMLHEGFTHDGRVRGTGLGFLKRRFGYEGFDNFGHDGGTTIFISHFDLSLKEDFMLFSSFSGPGAGQTHSAYYYWNLLGFNYYS
ncbi:MAG: hypothetical protein ABGY96_16140 [bacterium]